MTFRRRSRGEGKEKRRREVEKTGRGEEEEDHGGPLPPPLPPLLTAAQCTEVPADSREDPNAYLTRHGGQQRGHKSTLEQPN